MNGSERDVGDAVPPEDALAVTGGAVSGSGMTDGAGVDPAEAPTAGWAIGRAIGVVAGLDPERA